MLRALLLAIAPLAAAQTVLNVSHDLTTLNIAAQNMAPNTPTLDSRPLLEAAVTYAQAHSIPTITSDPGAYYFLTGHPSGRYFSFNGLHDLTFDFAGSDLYFQLGSWTNLECDNCQNVQFLNFTMDALQLPFTQLQVTSVDTATNRIHYTVMSGWEAATNFNTVRNPTGATEPLYAFIFRNGKPLRTTSRIAIQRPIDPAYLPVMDDGSPWGNPKQLASIQPGDLVALTARAGGPTLVTRNGSNINVRNVAVYFSGAVGVMLQSCPNSTVEQVQVIPRPGTDRLVSTNADGISSVQLGQNLVIRGSRIKRTADDGISPNSQELAVVTGQPAANQVTVNRSAYQTFPNGLQVQFIDNKTGFPLVTAHITNQDPPFSTATPVFGSAATLTFDQNIPALAQDDPMVYADPAFRGSGLLIENNLVEEVLQARGMSIWGIVGGVIQHNVTRNLPWGGINPIEHLSIRDWMTGPTANLTIQGNVIEQFDTAFGSGIVGALAAIDMEADDLNFNLITTGSPFQNVTMTNNFINSGPFSGIFVQNLNEGSVTGNLLMNVATNPHANNANANYVAQLGQPIVIAASTGVTSMSNTIDTTTPPAYVTSAVSFADDAVAPDSWAAVQGTKLAPKTDIAATFPFPTNLDGVTVSIQDSAGVTTLASIWFISANQINFLVPTGVAPGAAVVTVTSGTTVTGRGGILIDSIAPALFTVNGSGAGPALGAAVLTHANGTQDITALTDPISLGQTGDVATLVLYATGMRNRISLSDVVVYIGDLRIPVQYGAAQGTYAGLDQINVNLPSQLRGAGQVALRVVVGGLSSNSVAVTIQ
jgi:uncharacterized protein (TIGR03437 family)